MQNTLFYKFLLELDQQKDESRLNISKRSQDILEASDRFNTRFSGTKHIMILRLTSSTLDLLLKLDNHASGKSVDIRTISSFITTLKRDYNWKAYVRQGTGRLFRAQVVKQLDTAEYKKILKDLDNQQGVLYDSGSTNTLFTGIDNDKENIPADSQDTDNSGAAFEVGCTQSADHALDRINNLIGATAFKKEMGSIAKIGRAHV